ncbi:MAG: site-2 protease family protein [Acidobacteriota bacterium]
MGRNTIPLGRILGIPIGLDYTWFLIFGLITWSLAASYYPHEFPGWPAGLYWAMGALTAILLFASVLLHELGHSVVAMRYKIPVRSITLFIFGGVAQIGAEPPSALAEFWIAVAGPAVSLALALLFGLLRLSLTSAGPVLALAEYLALINGMLVLFNLIPGFPLDGGRVLRAVVWGVTGSFRKATLMAAWVGRFVALLFIFYGVWEVLTGNFMDGVWIAFIGWFLDSAAAGQIHTQDAHDVLAGHRVSEAMSKEYASVPADLTLQRLVDEHILGSGRRCFVVERGNSLAGLLTLHRLREIPRASWATTTCEQAMIPVEKLQLLAPDTELWRAVDEMQRDGVNQLPVIDGGRMVGMLTREDTLHFLRNLSEFGR